MAATPSITIYVQYPGSDNEASYIDILVKSGGVLNPAFPDSTSYDAWCLDRAVNLPTKRDYTAGIYSTYELGLLAASVPTLAANPYLNKLDSINWLLNHYTGSNPDFSAGDVQGAIWKMMGSDPLAAYLAPQSQANIDALVAEALSHDGYVPDAGEAIAVVLDPIIGGTHFQPIVIETRAARLGDRVWHDLDADGIQDAGESGIGGASVQLVRDQNGDGDFADAFEVLATTATDASGNYAFKGLTPGLQYQVRFSLPAGFDLASPRQSDGSATSGANSDGALSDVVILAPGENNVTLDAGFYQSASLGDRLWLDANANGQQDAGETGIQGATVTLLGGSGNTVASTTTGADGIYGFSGLTPGVQYQVQFSKPADSVFTTRDSGPDASDSDADTLGLSHIVTLASGENNLSIDAGIYETASLGDRLWFDANANGQQDTGETGINGATVKLLGGGSDGLLATLGDNTVASTSTGADGIYGFSGLTPGVEYQVQFIKPAGSVFTSRNTGVDASDSDADNAGLTQVVTLASGENNVTLDAGIYETASLGDRLWLDANANGQQDAGETGVQGATVTLLGGTGNVVATTTTGADGIYGFSALTPGVEYQVQFSKPAGSIFTGRNVGNDASDSDVDSLGLTQTVTLASGENNLTLDAGIYSTASLGDRLWLDANANGQQDAGETGVQGAAVTLLGSTGNTLASTTTGADGAYRFDGLTPGVQYQVQFSKPDGSVFTGQNIGNDAGDSDASALGLTQLVTLASGEHNPTLDAGIYATASLGDRLWFDTNANGQQDAGETGVLGANVKLTGGGADGLLATAADNTVATVTTGADGIYGFSGLTPGVEYQVQFTQPAGTVFTGQNIGNDASDSDVNAAGQTQIVKLASGENNLTLDAGVFESASLGDRLWLDANANGQQDAGETGIQGASVTLLGGGADGLLATAGDNTSSSTTTAANGIYGFSGLTPGVEYQVQFSKPAGSVFTGQDIGNDASDSDVDTAGLTQIVKLASGENNLTLDAGVYATASLGDRLWLDANANGQQDAGETGIQGASVTLLGGGADGLLATAGDNTSSSTTTAANGIYGFSGLTAGVEYQVQFSKPAGSVFTGQNIGNDASDSDVDTAGLTQIVKLASGENNLTLDAGVYASASLGDRLWLDANANGQQDAGETGIQGASVTLLGGGADGLLATAGDNTSSSTTTAANGIYGFSGLTPGVEYQVEFSKPAGSVFTGQNIGNDASDSDVNTAGLTQIVKLVSGENNLTLDAGVYTSASLGDRLWVDSNANGQQDDGATGVAGQTITLAGGGADGLLSTLADNTSASTVTGADGVYKFSNLTPGVQYQVTFSKPAGYNYTTQNSGADSTDSDAGLANGVSQVVTLGSGEYNGTIDAGLTCVNGDLSVTKTDGLTTVTPGQTITYTIVAKNQGSATATNAVISDAMPANLTNVTWTSVASAGASANQLSGSGNISDTVTMAPGSTITYTVTAKVPALSVLEQVADFGTGTNNTNLGQNVNVAGVRADAFYLSGGYKTTNTVLWGRNETGDHGLGVWSSQEGNPVAGGGDVNELSNQKNQEVIRLSRPANEQWSSLWVSSLDGNGSGGAEMGTMYWSNSATPDLATLSTKFTFKSGDFGLGVVEGDLLALQPAGFDVNAKYVFFVAGPNAAGTNNDYLVWKAGTVDNRVTNTVTIAAPDGFTDNNPGNNSATDQDFIKTPSAPLPARGSLGNFVFEDLDFDGVQDAGEPGIPGVTVRLLNAANGVIASTVTSASGGYLFSNLAPADYKISVLAPSGYYLTKTGIGGDTLDSDIYASTGRSDLTTISAGENDMSWDAGMYRKASIGDKVFRDSDHDDIQDVGEEGIPGVKVALYSTGGTLLASTVTNESGNYKFANLDPGSYYLRFDKGNVVFKGFQMNNWKWASKNIGSNDSIDSDVRGDGEMTTNVTYTDATVLTSGENDMRWDAGITPIAIDLNGDGIQTLARDAGAPVFDLLGNGKGIASGWLSGGDGFLAVDTNGNGSIDGIGELFGGSAKGAGFAKLATFDSNGDGMVDAGDSAFAALRVWQDANGNRSTDAGELLTMAQAGVTALAVGFVELPYLDGQGNLHLERSSATLASGARTDMTDVYFAVAASDVAGSGAAGLEELSSSGSAVLVGNPAPWWSMPVL